jgi:hypothetical protein
MSGSKNPHDTVFWNDIEHDEKLKTASYAAAGFWLRHLLPMAARSRERGVILVDGHPCIYGKDLTQVLANILPGGLEVISTLLDELVRTGTASVDRHGRLINRRMVKERQLSETRSRAGRSGAQARWQTDGKHHGKADGKEDQGNLPLSDDEQREFPDGAPETTCEVDSKPMHSSSFSTSSSNGESLTEERGRAKSRAPSEPRAATTAALPADWQPNDDLRSWTVDTLAATNARDRVDIDREVMKFRDHYRGRAKSNRGWAQAWRNWIWKAIEWSERYGQGPKPHVNGRQSSAFRTRANLAAAISGAGGAGPAGDRGRDRRHAHDGAGDLEGAGLSDPAGAARGRPNRD